MKVERKIEEIRRKLTPFQKKLIEAMWKHYLTKKEWPVLRELNSRFGTGNVKKAISAMGRGI